MSKPVARFHREARDPYASGRFRPSYDPHSYAGYARYPAEEHYGGYAPKGSPGYGGYGYEPGPASGHRRPLAGSFVRNVSVW